MKFYIFIIFFIPFQTFGHMVTGILMGKEEILIKTKSQGDIQSILKPEGAFVKSGDVLAVIDDREEQLQLKLSKVEFETAKNDYEKTKKLGKYVSKEEILQKENLYLKKKTQYELKKYNLKNTKMIAPINGVVSKCLIKKGENIASGTQAFEVINQEKLVIELDISARNIKKLKVHGELNFFVENDEKQKYLGRISYIAPVIDKSSGTVRVKLELDNPKDKNNNYLLRPGSLVNVKL